MQARAAELRLRRRARGRGGQRGGQREAERFADLLQLTLPVLYDEGGLVHDQYVSTSSVPAAAFPQEWIVGRDGTIVYQASQYNYDSVVDVIEAELAGE